MRRVEEAHGAWTEAEAERPGDSWIHQAAGRSYEAAGLRDLALSWRTRGLHQALRCGEADLIEILLAARPQRPVLVCERAPVREMLSARGLIGGPRAERLAAVSFRIK